jgi:hypothetical protein
MTEKNSCDGCNAKMPIKNGVHYTKAGHIHMSCQAEKYTSRCQTCMGYTTLPDGTQCPDCKGTSFRK